MDTSESYREMERVLAAASPRLRAAARVACTRGLGWGVLVADVDHQLHDALPEAAAHGERSKRDRVISAPVPIAQMIRAFAALRACGELASAMDEARRVAQGGGAYLLVIAHRGWVMVLRAPVPDGNAEVLGMGRA